MALAVIYLVNMQITVMDVDAAQYASISMEMMDNHSYLQVYENGADYLDKPPLLFWLSSLSMRFLGASSFSYKLPAVLILILGIFSTWKFVLQWYDAKRARLAALVLASCQAFFLMSNDVRTDGILTGFVMFSVWQISSFIRTRKFLNLLLAALGCGAAMMAKGPIALVIPALAFGTDILLKRNWKVLFRWQWLLFLLIVAVVLLPMCYGLYIQFDLHPEKEVYGLHGPSGLRFFFWTQSFGRITGENYWDDGSSAFYFLHTILWDFQPWILLLIPALYQKGKTLVSNHFRVETNTEYISFSGFVLIFIALSSSHYKLPHYIFVIMPFAAILTADFIYNMQEKSKKWHPAFVAWQFRLMGLFFFMALVYEIYVFPPESPWLPIVILIFFIIYYLSYHRGVNIYERIVFPTMAATLLSGFILSCSFYPNLLFYQSASRAGMEATGRQMPLDMFYSYGLYSGSMSFYAKRNVPMVQAEKLESYKKGTLIYTNAEGKHDLEKMNYGVLQEYENYRVTSLDVNFMNRYVRKATLRKAFLMKKYK